MKRKSYTCISDFSWKSPAFFFFQKKTKRFWQEPGIKVFFWKETLFTLKDVLFDSLQQNLTFKTSLSEELLFCSEDPIFVWEEHYFVILL